MRMTVIDAPSARRQVACPMWLGSGAYRVSGMQQRLRGVERSHRGPSDVHSDDSGAQAVVFVLLASMSTRPLATSHVCAQKRPLKRAVASPFTRNFAALQRPGPALPRGAARRARRLPASLHPGRGLSLHHGRDAAQQRLWESPTKRKRQAAAGRDAAGLLALFCHTSESRARDDGLLSMYIMGGPLLRLVIDLVPASFIL